MKLQQLLQGAHTSCWRVEYQKRAQVDDVGQRDRRVLQPAAGAQAGEQALDLGIHLAHHVRRQCPGVTSLLHALADHKHSEPAHRKGQALRESYEACQLDKLKRTGDHETTGHYLDHWQNPAAS